MPMKSPILRSQDYINFNRKYRNWFNQVLNAPHTEMYPHCHHGDGEAQGQDSDVDIAPSPDIPGLRYFISKVLLPRFLIPLE